MQATKILQGARRQRTRRHHPPQLHNESTAVTFTKPYKLSRLISLFHQSENFAPLKVSQLDNYLIPIIVPEKTYSAYPTPIDLRSLLQTQQALDYERVKLDTVPSYTSVNLSIAKNQPVASAFGNDEMSLIDAAKAGFVMGAEPPMLQRIRRVVDTLHGTQAGGQAGLQTLLDNAQSIRMANKDEELGQLDDLTNENGKTER